ncbi:MULTISPECIES: CopG family transcriptional regulator [unclassified Sphingomonas]|uniref:ribbon-helix-helix domain-containing protein n=1 Tax=unclassified Sphingomonas TaxID=196159 RepID=UPI0012E0CF66|nr:MULTISPECIES: CopG family transcriptional regulator [unclassified Sphingomonas]
MSFRHSTVRLTPEQFARVEALAKQSANTPSDIIRQAVGQHLDRLDQVSQGNLRHHRISEYTQIAIDAIITQQYPDLRPRILAETDRRMEKYHAE